MDYSKIAVIMVILCLSMFSLILKVQAKSPKISSVSDPADDLFFSKW